jgi:hypothetical protein
MIKAQMRPKTQRNIFLRLALSIILAGAAFAGETERKFSIDINYNRNDFMLKIKPIDYTFLTKTRRIDLLAGKRFRSGIGEFKVFGYLKIDNKDRTWLGTRLNYGRKALGDRLLLDLELRFFQGLNGKSKNHVYVIPSAYYALDKNGRFLIGASGYGKKIVGEKPFFYLGVDAWIRLVKHVRTLVSYSLDTYGAGPMVWWIFSIDL